MKNISFKIIISRFTLFSLLLFTVCGNNLQTVYSQENPNLSNINTVENDPSQLEHTISIDIEKDDKTTVAPKTDRVIIQTNIELVEDDACECAYIATSSGGFPFYALFAIGGGAFIPVALNSFDEEPPPSQTNVVSPSTP